MKDIKEFPTQSLSIDYRPPPQKKQRNTYNSGDIGSRVIH